MADDPYVRHRATAQVLCRSSEKRNGQEAFGFRKKNVSPNKVAKTINPAIVIYFAFFSTCDSSMMSVYIPLLSCAVMYPSESEEIGISWLADEYNFHVGKYIR